MRMHPIRSQEFMVPCRDPQSILLRIYELVLYFYGLVCVLEQPEYKRDKRISQDKIKSNIRVLKQNKR